ncbi:MAG: hypothetical protein LPK00_08695 [Bacillaceae bacterium]|nr:hypothetical protein [Bacillaceae bacterium]
MKKSIQKPLLITILSLAGFYVVYELFTNTGSFITRLLVIIGVATVIFFLFRYFISGRIGGADSNYRKALQQSKKKYNAKSKPVVTLNGKERKPTKSTSSIKRKSSTHLTVIEGKKNKKKNRAFF